MDACGKDCLTKEDIEFIAERAADRALEKFYADVGRSVVKRGLLIAGGVATALWTYLKIKG